VRVFLTARNHFKTMSGGPRLKKFVNLHQRGIFQQPTKHVCSTRLLHYCLTWMLIIQLGQPLMRSEYRDKTVVVVVLW